MAGVSYFQRYSQRENHVTNNVLLVLRHFYQEAPAKLEQIIGDLFGQVAITIGPSFHQQARGIASVPDGLVAQAAFRLYFETKRGAAPGREQLERHVVSIAHAGSSASGEAFLVALSMNAMPTADREAIVGIAAARGVAFTAVTFADLVAALDDACAKHEAALAAILADFKAYLDSEGLLFDAQDWMLVAPCGLSFAENAKFGVYYDLAHRPRRSPCAYFGAYRDKRVGLVGRIEAVLVCRCVDGKVELIDVERGEATSEALGRIGAMIEATHYYDLSAPHRYWVMDELAATTLTKRDRGPVRGAQYLQISRLLPPGVAAKGPTGAALAQQLDGLSFPRNGNHQ